MTPMHRHSPSTIVLLAAGAILPVACSGCRLVRGEASIDSLASDVVAPAKLVANITDVPSQRRDWRPELSVLPYAEFDGDQVILRNIRGCRWRTSTDYDVKHSDWRFAMQDVRSVDFIVVPFPSTPMLAHTMLSFGLSDGRYVALSVEARLEAHESYSAVGGAARQFDLIYVLADEEDLIGLRAEVRRDDIYVYRTLADPAKSAELLRHVLQRANQLSSQPEFYDSLRNSCATNIAKHIEQVRPGNISNDWRLVLPGHSDKLAYELGLIDTSRPFEEVRRRAFISLKARQHLGHPEFSRMIRQDL